MNITVTRVQSPQCMIVAVDGRLVGAAAIELEAVLQRAIAEGATRLVLDLSDSPIISSAGLRVIISTAKRVRAVPSGDLRLAGASRQILDVLELAGLLKVIKVYESRQEAMQSFEAT